MKNNLIIKQQDLTDCGPACLLSVIIYYGGFVPIEMLRSNAYTDKSGTSAFNLINCAKKFGLSGSGIRINNIDSVGNNKIPCIAHLTLENGLYHYVVIYKIYKNHLLIMDPQKGKIKISKSDFKKLFSGVIILLHPYTKITKINKPNSIKKLITKTIKDNMLSTFMLFFISVLLIIMSIILNYYLKFGVSLIDKKYDKNLLLFFSLIYLNFYLVKNILEFIKNKLVINFNKNISCEMYDNFSKRIFNLPLNFIKSRTSGEIISRFNELSNIKDLLPNIILSVVIDLVMAFVTICFALLISIRLTVFVIIFMILYFFIGYKFKNPTLKKINKNLDENANFNSNVIEIVNNLRSIKNLNNESNMNKRLNRSGINVLYYNYLLDSYYNKINCIKNTLYDLMFFVISSYGLYLIYLNKINIVDLFTFLMIINYFTEPIKELIDMFTKFCFIKSSISKINEFYINYDEKHSSNKEFKMGDIIVDNVSYAYNGVDYIIKNYSCFIEKQSKVLIKGSSGSGKSTLCQLISNQLTNYDGNIFIDNNNLKEINNETLRRNVTYIGQKDSLIIDTIKNNIKYERNIDEKEFNTICKICEIDKIIEKKFDRFDNIICESSDNISGGEKQRISLARGLINSGKILILDESLSEVNKDMEERILKKIFKHFYDRTIIYVSHKNYQNIFDKVIRI